LERSAILAEGNGAAEFSDWVGLAFSGVAFKVDSVILPRRAS
jgi:hypothetical protein